MRIIVKFYIYIYIYYHQILIINNFFFKPVTFVLQKKTLFLYQCYFVNKINIKNAQTPSRNAKRDLKL
jgi:hypothetical protein